MWAAWRPSVDGENSVNMWAKPRRSETSVKIVYAGGNNVGGLEDSSVNVVNGENGVRWW